MAATGSNIWHRTGWHFHWHLWEKPNISTQPKSIAFRYHFLRFLSCILKVLLLKYFQTEYKDRDLEIWHPGSLRLLPVLWLIAMILHYGTVRYYKTINAVCDVYFSLAACLVSIPGRLWSKWGRDKLQMWWVIRPSPPDLKCRTRVSYRHTGTSTTHDLQQQHCKVN